MGLSDDSVKFNGATTVAKLKIDNSFGVFLKPKAMLNENIEIFGRLGYMNSKLTASGAGLSLSDSDSGFAYGLGANYYVNKNTYLTVSYLNAYDKDSTTISGVTFGLGTKF